MNWFFYERPFHCTTSKAATETVFQNICSFFPRTTLLQFSRMVYLFVEQTCFSRRVYICSSNRHKFSKRVYRTDMFFQGGFICSSNRPYYLIEQILIFPKTFIPRTHTNFPIFQKLLFSHRTDINFLGASIFSSNRY